MSADRAVIITGVHEAMQAGARQSAACEIIGISAKTLQRALGHFGSLLGLGQRL